jgi:predicted ATPase with chaperone activity
MPTQHDRQAVRTVNMEVTTLMVPHQVQRTGVRKGLLEDLALKLLYLHGEMSLLELSERTCLSLGVIDEIFQFFRKEQLCEVKRMAAGSHVIVASAAGKQRAGELLAMNQYIGPAPVSLADYSMRVSMQSVQQIMLTPADVSRAFYQMVLDQELLTRLGTALVSGTSMFLHGPSGTGKTSIAATIPAVYDDNVWIPHAVVVDNQIVSVFDPGVHQQNTEAMNASGAESDRRWVLCKRPCVLAGGELSAEMLDLQFNPQSKFYTAPLQMKANNGVLILDDFGRQRMRPDELLNRWMTPLDRRVDFLTLPGGRKFEVPFDLFVVFATNLDPNQLADEAFLRRIPNKIKVGYATAEQFLEIFRRECQVRLITCDDKVPEFLVECLTKEMKQPLAHCHARDLINQIFWAARYAGVEPHLTRETVEQACRAHFVPVDKN